jgi:hypothetical protein
MNFYKLTSMGGLSVNLEPYCEKLTQNIATDKVETPLCQEILPLALRVPRSK